MSDLIQQIDAALKRGFHVTDVGVADLLLSLRAQLQAAEQERDALREALARIVRGYDGPTVDIGTAVSAAIPAARALLAEPPT